MTTLSPAKTCGSCSTSASANDTPASPHFVTMSRCQGSANHSATASAMIGPTPSVAANCSCEASSMAASERNAAASARAAVGPTCRMDRATRTRHNGRSLASCNWLSRASALAVSSRVPPCPARVKNAQRARSAAVTANRSLSSWTRSHSSSATAAFQPRPSMSRAPREPTWNNRSRNCEGHDRTLGHRMSTSASFSGASCVPHAGQWVGITNSRSVPSRSSTTGPMTSGITSPALRRNTRSPISTPLRFTSLAL